uniref:Uncharacterized protein n=1 Tax=Plectus sambesii TaxID=2011161 RepID=A0A914W5Y3_9BILA
MPGTGKRLRRAQRRPPLRGRASDKWQTCVGDSLLVLGGESTHTSPACVHPFVCSSLAYPPISPRSASAEGKSVNRPDDDDGAAWANKSSRCSTSRTTGRHSVAVVQFEDERVRVSIEPDGRSRLAIISPSASGTARISRHKGHLLNRNKRRGSEEEEGKKGGNG